MRFPIDVVMVGGDGRVVEVCESMGPWRMQLPRFKAKHVIEMRAGLARELGISAGTQLDCEGVVALKVEVVQNGEVILSKDFPEGSWKIGRDSACDIRLKSPQVSKQHALLVIKGNKAAIVDLGSSNGVFVNGILVRKQRIEPGDEVKIVGFQIRVNDPESERRTSASADIAVGGGTPTGSCFRRKCSRQFELTSELRRRNPRLPNSRPRRSSSQLMDQKYWYPTTR